MKHMHDSVYLRLIHFLTAYRHTFKSLYFIACIHIVMNVICNVASWDGKMQALLKR